MKSLYTHSQLLIFIKIYSMQNEINIINKMFIYNEKIIEINQFANICFFTDFILNIWFLLFTFDTYLYDFYDPLSNS